MVHRYPLVLAFLFFLIPQTPGTHALAVISSGRGLHLLVTPGQPMFGVNLDGVARVQFNGQTQCTAALITDQHLLSAAHCFDGNLDGAIDSDADTILEAVLEDSAGKHKMEFLPADVSIPPNWTERPADIAIIRLPSSAPDVFPRYPLYGEREEVGKQIVLVGYGVIGTGDQGGIILLDDRLAGLNRYEALGTSIDGTDDTLVYDFDSGLTENNSLAAMGLASDLGFGPDEVQSADGDSGGPVFIAGAIAGVNSYSQWGFETDFDPDVIGTWGEITFDTRVSSFQEFLTTATDAQVIFVPEPSSSVLLMISVAFALAVRRLHQRRSRSVPKLSEPIKTI